MLHGCSYSLDVVVLFAAAFVASALLSGTQKIHRYLHTPYVCYRQKPCMFVDTCNFLPRIVCASRSICASRSRLQSVASASSGLNSSSACCLHVASLHGIPLAPCVPLSLLTVYCFLVFPHF